MPLYLATVDEAAITGASTPFVRESGGDRSAVTGGKLVISGRVVIRVTMEKGYGFVDRMILMVKEAKRQKTPKGVVLTILLSTLVVCVTLNPFGSYFSATFRVPVLIALLVCLIPKTIGGLLSAIGISGINRLVRRDVMATSGRAVKAAGDVDLIESPLAVASICAEMRLLSHESLRIILLNTKQQLIKVIAAFGLLVCIASAGTQAFGQAVSTTPIPAPDSKETKKMVGAPPKAPKPRFKRPS
jgi:hypothetical protein